MPDLETSRKQSAQRQIETAIALFHKGDLDCAITLAAAAEGSLPEPEEGSPYLIKALRTHPEQKELELNLVINWLKHYCASFETATISEFEATIVIARAITKYIAVYRQSCRPFEEFLQWGHAADHLPKLYKG